MTDEMKAKREGLKIMSRAAKMGIAAGLWDSVNEGLVEMYLKDGHEEIHSYKKWIEKGYQVRKGEKALLLWGEPRKGGKQEKQIQPTGEADEYKFFPMAYVFSNLQVDKIEEHAEAL